MKIAGALTIAAGAMVAAFFFLAPTSISVLGFSGSCGSPIVVATSHSSDPITNLLLAQCRAQSISRIYTGLGVALVGLLAGAAIIGAAPTSGPQGGGAAALGSDLPLRQPLGPEGLPTPPKRWTPIVRRVEKRPPQ